MIKSFNWVETLAGFGIRKAEYVNFEHALVALRNQKRLTRQGWNAAGQYVMFQKGYPNGININQNTADASGLNVGTMCIFEPYFMAHTADGHFVPWLPSTSDLLAEDWLILGLE